MRAKVLIIIVPSNIIAGNFLYALDGVFVIKIIIVVFVKTLS